LLKRGEQDFSYVAGWEREANEGVLKYHQPVATAYHRVGVNDSITIGAQGEARYTAHGFDVASGGLGALTRVGRLGMIGAEVLASRLTGHGTGYAATVGYSYQGPITSFELRGTWAGPRFGNLSFEPTDKPQNYLNASTSVSLGRLGSVTVARSKGQGEKVQTRVVAPNPQYSGPAGRKPPQPVFNPADPIERILKIGYTASLASRLQFSVMGIQSRLAGQPTIWTGFCSLTFLIKRSTTLSSITSLDRLLSTCNIGMAPLVLKRMEPGTNR
jgi:hypothetical protein